MTTYDLYQHREMIDGTTDEQMPPLFEAIKKELAEYHPRTFGRADNFVVGVVMGADLPDQARERWYEIVDPAIDRVIASNRTRQMNGPNVSEKR